MSKVNDLADMLEEVARDTEAFDYYSGAVAQTEHLITLLEENKVQDAFIDFVNKNL